MQEICAEAGISAGALYRYFSGKAEIISAIAEESRAESESAFLRAAHETGFFEALSMTAAQAFQRLTGGDGALYADVMAEAMRDRSIAKVLRSIDERSISVFAGAVAAAQARGEIDATLDPKSSADVLFALIEGIGLRRALLAEPDIGAAVEEFRAVAERYLSPRHET